MDLPPGSGGCCWYSRVLIGGMFKDGKCGGLVRGINYDDSSQPG